MDNQLKNISTQYRKFSKGQYVEHTQFNEFLDFFEDQDRLSRVMLQGVGIVCGFEPKIIKNNRLTALQLSQGIAITTDGDLLTLNNKSTTKNVENDSYMSELKNINLTSKQYTHYKVYDNSKVKYPVFYKDPENQIELWELATETEAKKDFEPLQNFINFEDKYLLLYLESYEKEVKPCIGVDCDNHGVQQVRNLKVLVTTKEGIAQIIEQDDVCPHPLFLNLTGEERLKRIILKPEEQTAHSIKQLFKDVTLNTDYQNIFGNIDRVCEIMGIPAVDRSGFIAEIETLVDKPENFQYAYGALKDITTTYSEIVKQLSRTFTKCLPDLTSFPKHIMLGKINSQAKYENTRHLFYNSPVLDNEKMDYERLRQLIYRFNILNYTFKDPAAIAAQEGIKITPSKNISSLGNKAIPFYYNIHEDLLSTWSFDKTVNRASKTNLSYATAMLSPDIHIQSPLGYDKGGKLFYRIEGHQGLGYDEAVSSIKKIKDDQQLGFDVVALSLTQLKDNKDLSKAYFTDYVEKHPGLEHLGGVKSGGTFVVVYQSEEDKTVIADFALPYICCTPKSDVGLTLPVSTICEDESRLIFNVTPANGVVKADVSAELTGGVEEVNGQYMFNPQLVENSLLNTEIGFKVNGKPTNCTINVLSLPAVNIIARDFVYPEEGSITTTVTFNVSGEDFDKYDYKWDFLDNGSYISIQPDTAGDVRYQYSNIDETKPVKVLVDTNGCTEVKTLTDWYKPEGTTAVALTLPVSTICENEPRLTFNVTPTDGVVGVNIKADVTGGVELVDGKYMFNPQLVEESLINTQINFTVNGESTDCSITVLPLPDVNIVASEFVYPQGDITTTTVIFNVSGESFMEYKYKWDFLDDGRYIELQPDEKGNVRYDYSEIDEAKPVNIAVDFNECTEVKILRDWYKPQSGESNLSVKIVPSQETWTWRESGDNTVPFASEVTGAGSTPTYQWSCTDAKVIIDKVDSSAPNIQFPSAGQFEITLDVTDGENSGSETIFYNVVLPS